jgi:hypothetical protein
MGAYPIAKRPLTPPHRTTPESLAWAKANDDPAKDIEAMMPKDILKFAEKVENVEEAVLKELEKKEQIEIRIDARTRNQYDVLFRQPSLAHAPGAIVPISSPRAAVQLQLQQAQQAQLQQLAANAANQRRGSWETSIGADLFPF